MSEFKQQGRASGRLGCSGEEEGCGGLLNGRERDKGEERRHERERAG